MSVASASAPLPPPSSPPSSNSPSFANTSTTSTRTSRSPEREQEEELVKWSIGTCLIGSLALLSFTLFDSATRLAESSTTISIFFFFFALFVFVFFSLFFLQPARWASLPLGVGVLDLLLTLVVLTDRNPRDLYCWFVCIPPLMLHARGLGSCAAALVLVLLQTSALRYVVSSSTVSLNGGRHTLLGASMSDGWLLVVVTVCAVGARYSRDAALRGQLHKALDEAARAKSDFLANISHELRTPMHGIIAMSSELQSTLTPNTKASQAVAIIADCADHLLSMVNDLLDVARIEAHQLELAHIPFSVVSETHKVIDMLRSHAAKKQVEVTAVVDVARPQRMGDPVRFRQVVYSLLSNAIKFTPEKGAISVNLTSRSDSGLLELTVRDTGIGISEDHIANLFSCFTQADASVSRRYGGSGLGLAISKRLCDAMGGTIGVVSQPSQGSTFTVTLPLPCAAEPKADTVTTGAAAGEESVGGIDHNRKQEKEMKEEQDEDVGGRSTERGAFEGLEVLLVEDNAINQLVGKRMLRSLGCHVTVAANGLECVQMLERRSDEVAGEKASTMYDVILMDCQMPVMDGFKATQHIRALETKASGAAHHQSPSLPIIALTASATKEYSRKCVEVGMSDVLFKPLRREMLAAALAKWAPTARGTTATTSTTTASAPSPSSTTTATTTTAQHIARSKSDNSSFPVLHSPPLPLHDSSTPSSSSSSSSSSSTAAGGGSRNRSRSLPMPVPPPRPSLASSSSASAVKSLRETIANPTARRALLFTRKEST